MGNEGQNRQPLHQRLFGYSQKWYWKWVTGACTVYVKLNKHGSIVAVSDQPLHGYWRMDPPEGEESNVEE